MGRAGISSGESFIYLFIYLLLLGEGGVAFLFDLFVSWRWLGGGNVWKATVDCPRVIGGEVDWEGRGYNIIR